MSGYRERAEKALGRALRTTEHVHHHSEKQLVICDRRYHSWLHRQMRMRGIKSPDHATSQVLHVRLSESTMKQLATYAIKERRGLAQCVRIIVEDRLADEAKKTYEQKRGVVR